MRLQYCNGSKFLPLVSSVPHVARHPHTASRHLAAAAAFGLALALAGIAAGAPGRAQSAARVTVTFTDSTLRVSVPSPESGMTTFVVLNKGKKRHVLSIAGPGLKGVQTAKLTAGAHTTLTVRLRPGAYVLSDPIGLGVYKVQFLNVVRSTVVSARGDGSVVAPPVDPPPMCGQYFTP
jgi:hypothetical protein